MIRKFVENEFDDFFSHVQKKSLLVRLIAKYILTNKEQ